MTMLPRALFDGGSYALQPDMLLGPAGEIENGVVAVDSGRILAAGAPDDPALAAYGLERIVRLEGCAIIPGFVDAHHHISTPFAKALTFGEPAQMWKRIWMPLWAAETVESNYLGSKWAFLEALRGGVTTIVNHSVSSEPLTEAIHQAAEDVGIRLVSSTGAYDLKAYATDAATPDASATIDEAIGIVEKHVANCRRYARVVPSVACGSVQTNTPEMIAALAQFCREHEILFQIHANEHTPEVHHCIETYGRRPIEHLHAVGALGPWTLIAHATLAMPHECRLLKETDTAVSYNPVASMWKGNAVAPALDFIELGIRFGLGSDVTRNDAFRLLDAAEACQRLVYGMPKDDFSCGAGWRWVHAGTLGGADAVGLGRMTGSLERGKAADFLILDCRQPETLPRWDFTWELVRLYDRSNILAVVVDGAPVLVEGRATRFDSDAFVREAAARGATAVTEAKLVRLHGTSATRRPRG